MQLSILAEKAKINEKNQRPIGSNKSAAQAAAQAAAQQAAEAKAQEAANAANARKGGRGGS